MALPRWTSIPIVRDSVMEREFDMDFERPMRIFDQHFGMGLMEDDIVPSSHSPFYSRGRKLSPKQQTGVSEIKQEGPKWQVMVDVQHFTPREILVKTVDNVLWVEASHEEKEDQHGLISRQFTRKFLIPDDVEPESVISSISKEGLLTVTAVRKPMIPPPPMERHVHIRTDSGPTSHQPSGHADRMRSSSGQGNRMMPSTDDEVRMTGQYQGDRMTSSLGQEGNMFSSPDKGRTTGQNQGGRTMSSSDEGIRITGQDVRIPYSSGQGNRMMSSCDGGIRITGSGGQDNRTPHSSGPKGGMMSSPSHGDRMTNYSDTIRGPSYADKPIMYIDKCNSPHGDKSNSPYGEGMLRTSTYTPDPKLTSGTAAYVEKMTRTSPAMDKPVTTTLGRSTGYGDKMDGHGDKISAYADIIGAQGERLASFGDKASCEKAKGHGEELRGFDSEGTIVSHGDTIVSHGNKLIENGETQNGREDKMAYLGNKMASPADRRVDLEGIMTNQGKRMVSPSGQRVDPEDTMTSQGNRIASPAGRRADPEDVRTSQRNRMASPASRRVDPEDMRTNPENRMASPAFSSSGNKNYDTLSSGQNLDTSEGRGTSRSERMAAHKEKLNSLMGSKLASQVEKMGSRSASREKLNTTNGEKKAAQTEKKAAHSEKLNDLMGEKIANICESLNQPEKNPSGTQEFRIPPPPPPPPARK